ncbi:MAG: Asp-tRNA(Asn)/Glu-tRNA(Gln) amidotransferase subunit GatC [Deltaproteobacteria bacterium]|nr:Asp-tRNA(Asn)/Glu-tRNA(Gln) amidotransferase subunit GatC [Deltaproteobacteria bacterium]
MSLSPADVRHIAMLARLELSQEEELAFCAQLDHILEHFEKLRQLDTENVVPTAHLAEMASAFREDVVSHVPAVAELLANAPARDGDFFKVPQIIE